MNVSRGRAEEQRVLLVPATRRDGEVVQAILDRTGIVTLLCATPQQAAAEIDLGTGALLLTDSALAPPGGAQILEALLRQPAWSDLPVLLLGSAEVPPEVARVVDRMTNVTLLERPAPTRSLVSAIHSALRARQRQFQLRDHLVALQEAQEALRQSDRRKDEFLAMLAHELRNPLAPIRTASELLPHIVPGGDARVDSTLRVVKRQVGQLARLVDDLLDVSRITQGRIQLQRDVLDLAAVLAQALESVEPLMAEKNHTLLRPAHLPTLHVLGDRARLVQCISNVLGNAAKYTDTGGTIEVGLSQEAGQAVVTVQDDGIGMSDELLPTIFDLFVQSERSLDRAQGGLGIGLSVVRRLVEMHEGSVSASSAGPGRGSRFLIRLPLVDAPVAQADREAAPAMPPRRLLVVDDNRDAADSLSMLLRLHGHAVQVAYDGEAALAMPDAICADLVLLDIGLPGMSGYEVARRLRGAGTTARLVALTGYGQPEDVVQANAAGFDAHLVKPVEFEQLLEVIRG